MEMIEHTVAWLKGEIFESWMFGLWGLAILGLAVFFWRNAHIDAARAFIIPFTVVGLFWGVAAAINVPRNHQRITQMRESHEKDPQAFVKTEKKRVEGFLPWYRYLLAGWSVLAVIGLALFLFWGGNLGCAVGIAMILFAVAGLMVDHTSEQNARKYYAKITKAVKS